LEFLVKKRRDSALRHTAYRKSTLTDLYYERSPNIAQQRSGRFFPVSYLVRRSFYYAGNLKEVVEYLKKASEVMVAVTGA
jgi:hypothetical protein